MGMHKKGIVSEERREREIMNKEKRKERVERVVCSPSDETDDDLKGQKRIQRVVSTTSIEGDFAKRETTKRETHRSPQRLQLPKRCLVDHPRPAHNSILDALLHLLERRQNREVLLGSQRLRLPSPGLRDGENIRSRRESREGGS